MSSTDPLAPVMQYLHAELDLVQGAAMLVLAIIVGALVRYPARRFETNQKECWFFLAAVMAFLAICLGVASLATLFDSDTWMAIADPRFSTVHFVIQDVTK